MLLTGMPGTGSAYCIAALAALGYKVADDGWRGPLPGSVGKTPSARSWTKAMSPRHKGEARPWRSRL